jgi:hypothetical protein
MGGLVIFVVPEAARDQNVVNGSAVTVLHERPNILRYLWPFYAEQLWSPNWQRLNTGRDKYSLTHDVSYMAMHSPKDQIRRG